MPTVSVVIPCYNYGRYLRRCVESVLTQSGVGVDVLIIDDASPDGSGDVAEQLAARDPRVGVVRHAANLGHIRTYNEGLERMTGDYCVILSADDLLTSGAFERATALMEAHPSVGFAYGHPNEFEDDAVPEARTKLRSWSIWPGRDWLATRFRRGFNCIYTPEVVVRAAVQKEIGGFREDLPHSGDMELWLRAASVADVGRVNGPDQALRRLHSANMSRTVFGGILRDLRGRVEAYEAFLDGFGSGTEGAAELRAAARRSVASQALAHVCDQEGPHTQAELDDLVSFAEELCDVTTLARWAELELRKPGTMGGRMRRRAYATERGLEARLRWRTWRWVGV